ncbi:MAG: hypothetical protein FJW39_13360 [Acidobacteria bacterium]|nr:hypothetical protein [Acidobacteriota bacterium]
MLGTARKFVSSVVPAIVKPLRVLWNEIIGFFFIVLALLAIPSAYRSMSTFNGDIVGLGRIVLTAIFGLVMLAYGVYSFRRARRINKT